MAISNCSWFFGAQPSSEFSISISPVQLNRIVFKWKIFRFFIALLPFSFVHVVNSLRFSFPSSFFLVSDCISVCWRLVLFSMNRIETPVFKRFSSLEVETFLRLWWSYFFLILCSYSLRLAFFGSVVPLVIRVYIWCSRLRSILYGHFHQVYSCLFFHQHRGKIQSNGSCGGFSSLCLRESSAPSFKFLFLVIVC
jgi:hypothetical protein